MNYANNQERERVIVQALSAQTLGEIEIAGRELRQWIADHPDDLSAEEALVDFQGRKSG